ncbi:hypothetical protein [Roseivirga pacifica]
MSDTIVKNRLYKSIESLTINKSDLYRFLRILQERANSACDIESNHIESFIPAENLDKSKEDLRSCSEIKVTINGQDGEELFGSIDEVFDSPSFPEQIKSLYLNTELIYKSRFNYIPRNRLEMLIDFSKPKVLDFSFSASEKTPNNSYFTVEGYDNTWVNGVYSEIDSFFKKRSSKVSKIHRNSIYDLVVWILGIPIGFWTCYKFMIPIQKMVSNSFLQSALYLYIFLFTLFIFQVLFHYFRWLYPKIQYNTSKDLSKIHRGFFYVITTSIIGAFLYDIISSFL